MKNVWVYLGHGYRIYPGRVQPDGGVLQVYPYEEIDFGDDSPPNDGAWYAVSDSGQIEHRVTDPPPIAPLLPGTGDGNKEVS